MTNPKYSSMFDLEFFKNGGRYMEIKITTKNTRKEFYFRDTYPIVSMPLSKVNAAYNLGLNYEKEV